jgi:hypothetical protein
VALVPERAQPIRVTEELQPVGMTEREPGDLGVAGVGERRAQQADADSVGSFLHEYVAGIRAAAPGYERVLIAPVPGELEWARASYRSVRGEIASAWRHDGDEFELEVTLPPNLSGTVVLPYGDGEPLAVSAGTHTLRVVSNAG